MTETLKPKPTKSITIGSETKPNQPHSNRIRKTVAGFLVAATGLLVPYGLVADAHINATRQSAELSLEQASNFGPHALKVEGDNPIDEAFNPWSSSQLYAQIISQSLKSCDINLKLPIVDPATNKQHLVANVNTDVKVNNSQINNGQKQVDIYNSDELKKFIGQIEAGKYGNKPLSC